MSLAKPASSNHRMRAVPEIGRFFGIIIRMFVEAGAPHHTPHFHAYYQEAVGVSASTH